MNLVMMTEGTGQGVHGRKTNVGRLYDLLAENRNQRINLEAGPGTHAFRHLGGMFFGTDAMSIVNHHQNWFLNHCGGLRTIRPTGADGRLVGPVIPNGPFKPNAPLKIFLFGFSRGALIMRVVAEWLCQRGFPVEYMGLWDTVDSTAGIRGEDYIALPSNVKFARHAVARDEQRRFFNYLPLKPYCACPQAQAAREDTSSTVEELVFPGSHSDVGGLYDDNHTIADVTLDWILEPAVRGGLRTIRPTDLDGHLVGPVIPNGPYDYKIHDSLKEPTNGWGLLDPVKRVLDGIRRHPLCERI